MGTTLNFTDDTKQVTWSGGTTTVTVNYVDQQAEMQLKSRAQIAVLIDYTKGDETTMEMTLETSPVVNFPIAVPATGTDYYLHSTIDASSNVFETQFSFGATKKYRLPIPLLHQECMLRISMKRTGGTDGGAGTFAVKVVDDSHPITSALTGRQP